MEGKVCQTKLGGAGLFIGGPKPWLVEAITAEQHKSVASSLASIEEAFLLRGSAEGAKLAAELTKTTGYILEYSVLDSKSGGGAPTLRSEIVETHKLPEAWHLASGVLANMWKTGGPIGALLESGALSADKALALILYTCSECAAIVNSVLRSEGADLRYMSRCVNLAGNFIQAFRILPSYWGTVYRGLALTKEELAAYVEGALILMKAFTSTSKDKAVAHEFAASEARGGPPGAHVRCLLTMESRSGRDLSDLSIWPKEREIVFRPYTTFRVLSVETKDGVCSIHMTEMHPDIRGRKILVWVDDLHAGDSKRIMDYSEKQGVTCVHLHSTGEAREFFTNNMQLLRRDEAGLRIITDMVRAEEDKKQNIEAGLDLARMLAEDFGYRRAILCFTGSTFLEANLAKFRAAGLKNVHLTARTVEARRFASFEALTGEGSEK